MGERGLTLASLVRVPYPNGFVFCHAEVAMNCTYLVVAYVFPQGMANFSGMASASGQAVGGSDDWAWRAGAERSSGEIHVANITRVSHDQAWVLARRGRACKVTQRRSFESHIATTPDITQRQDQTREKMRLFGPGRPRGDIATVDRH